MTEAKDNKPKQEVAKEEDFCEEVIEVPEHILVKCIDLIKTYSDTEVNVEALRGINLDIEKNEFMAIVGASGSGKTTLLNLIGGLDSPTSGQIYYEGDCITLFNETERSLYRRKIGFVFQDFYLHPVLTAAQNVELPLIYSEKLSKEERKETVLELLTNVGLEHRLKHIPAELSSGEKQRVGIARALANNPKLLLADQPTGNLDSETEIEIIDLLRKLKDKLNISIIVVTHNIEVAKKADRIMAIEDGIISPYEIPTK